MMPKQLKLMVLVNTAFVALYAFVNWLQYSALNHQIVVTNFPWYIQYSPSTNGPGLIAVIMLNFTLLVFLVAVLINVYFLIIVHKTSGFRARG